MLKNLLFCLLALLPSRIKRAIYNQCLGCSIHPTAFIGLSFVRCGTIVMGPDATIKHFNIIRGLARLEMGEKAKIGNWNTLTALPLDSKKHFQEEKSRYPALIMGPSSAIVKGHFFDCNHTITLGHHTIVAGQGTSFFTHGIDLARNRQASAPIRIGDYGMIGACCVVLKGSALPDCSVLGANSTLHKAFSEPYTLYSGVPAGPVAAFDPHSAYFHRDIGFVP